MVEDDGDVVLVICVEKKLAMEQCVRKVGNIIPHKRIKQFKGQKVATVLMN
jgi:hypothetical protein